MYVFCVELGMATFVIRSRFFETLISFHLHFSVYVSVSCLLISWSRLCRWNNKICQIFKLNRKCKKLKIKLFFSGKSHKINAETITIHSNFITVICLLLIVSNCRVEMGFCCYQRVIEHKWPKWKTIKEKYDSDWSIANAYDQYMINDQSGKGLKFCFCLEIVLIPKNCNRISSSMKPTMYFSPIN